MLVKVSSKGQITLPKSLREEMNIRPGDKLAIRQENDELLLKPLTKTIFDFIDVLPPGREEAEDWETIRQTAKEKIGRKYLQEMEDND